MVMKRICLLLSAFLVTGYVFSQDPPGVPEYCLENDIIHGYLNDFSYDTVSLDVSYVMDYFNRGKDAGYRMDAPKPIKLSWTPDPAAETQRIEVSEASDYSNPIAYQVSGNTAEYDLYNLIPGKRYYYRVISTAGGVDTTVGSGEFDTSGMLRMILGEGTWNVRDMGGWISNLTGQPIAYGKIYRGAQLKAKGQDRIILTADGIDALHKVGIKAELDLRSDGDVPSKVSALTDDTYYVDFNIISKSVSARMLNFDNNDAGILELQWIINELKQNKPVYFHCQNGADRTGTLGFLIGALLGMNESDLAKDYELTTFCEPYAAAYDPTEVGFARLRNYEGKKGSPLGSGDNADEYKYAKLVEKMRTVAPVNGTYQEKIYNFFRTGVNGKKISPADLSWFIKEMTGYSMLGGMEIDVDTLKLESGNSHTLIVKPMPEDAVYNSISFKSSNEFIATVSEEGLVTAVGGGEAVITVEIDGIAKYIPVIVPVTDDNIPSISIENELVSSFLSEVKYDAGDYGVSLIEKYDTVTTKYRKDWPLNALIKWNADKTGSAQMLLVSESPEFKSTIVDVTLDSKAESYYISGLKPDTRYYYSVSTSYSDKPLMVTTKSAFKTVGTVLMIKAEGVYNIRDLGGWTGIDGHKVRYGRLIRGSRLKNNLDQGGMVAISSDYIQVLRDMGVGAELDLRSDAETNSSASVLNRRQLKFKRIADANTCQGADVFTGDANIVAVKTIIEWLKADRGVYISGSLGADRTGTVAFLINGLLGVDEDALSKDYELSSFSGDNLEDVKRRRTDSRFVAMVEAIKGLDGADLQQKIYNKLNSGVNGTSIPAEDLNWFIGHMLGFEYSPQTSVVIAEAGKADAGHKIFNLLGQEVVNPGRGIYIMDGRKYIVE